VDTSDQCLVHLPGYYCTELPKAYNDEWDLMSVLRSRRSGPTPRGLFYYQHLFFAELTSYGHGCKGARHQRLHLRWWPLPDLPTAPQEAHHRRLQLQWWPLSDLPASPQGARHRRLQLRWWPLPNLPAAPPPGARHRRHQLWWWPLLDLPTAPSRGSAIDIANLLPATRIFLATPTREATTVNNTAIKNILGPCGAENPGVVIPLQKSPNQQTA
jgi:hypothetical protein